MLNHRRLPLVKISRHSAKGGFCEGLRREAEERGGDDGMTGQAQTFRWLGAIRFLGIVAGLAATVLAGLVAQPFAVARIGGRNGSNLRGDAAVRVRLRRSPGVVLRKREGIQPARV